MSWMRWPGRGSRESAFDWAGHERRAGDLVNELRSLVQRGYRYLHVDNEIRDDWIAREGQLSPEAITSLALLFIRQAVADDGRWGYDIEWGLGRVNPRKCAVTDADAVCALRTAAGFADTYPAGTLLSKALALAAQAQPGTSALLHSAIRKFADSVSERTQLGAPGRARLRRQLVALTLSGDQPDEVIDTSVVAPGDGWAAAVLPKLAAWHEAEDASAASANTLLRHLATASGSKPSKAWLARARELARDADAARVVRLLLETLAIAGTIDARVYGATRRQVLSAANADITRAAAWAAGVIDEPWVVPALRAAAYRGMHSSGSDYTASPKPANACVYSLGVIASAEAVAALQDLQRTTRPNGFRKQFSAALASAAQRAGLTPGQLAERVVPLAGLDADSERHLALAPDAAARVRITAECRVATDWRRGEGWVPRVPAGVEPRQFPELRAAVREVKDALAGERTRLESLLADDRVWDVAEWRDRYLAHPVTRPLARRLLWTIEDAAGEVAGLPGGDGKLVALDGERGIPPAATVRLWHPAHAATAQVQGWRDLLVRDGLVQPFKQAFREVYLLTPAERETRMYSNRFAAHILQYQQAYALMKARAWVTNHLGPHDGGHEGQARRDFAEASLTAVFAHYAVDAAAGGGQVDLCSTGRVQFHRTGDRARRPVPLEDVPDLVFSEAMRDVDLFVGVASIALDPNWADRGDAEHVDYWRAFSFGELSETAQIRRDALARIVPKLKIASRLELSDRFLRVHGHLNTYKIHVGSANIQIEPDDRYLCVVPGSSRRPSSKVMLPFEGDRVLSVILSKAVLLAADDKITDETILRQLRDRPGRGPERGP